MGTSFLYSDYPVLPPTVMKDNGATLEGGRVKRIKFPEQLKSTMDEVKELSERVDNTEQELSSLDETLNALTGELGDLQEQVQELLEDY